MQTIAAVLVGTVFFLAITFALLSAFSAAAAPTPSTPSPNSIPGVVKAAQVVECSHYATYQTSDYMLLVPDSYTDTLTLTAYSPLAPLQVLEVKPDVAGSSLVSQVFKPNIKVPGGVTARWSTRLASIGALSLNVMPGDRILVASATPRIDSGVIFISKSGILPTAIGQCPFNGLPIQQPYVNGQVFGVAGKGAACAPGVIATTMSDKVMVVAYVAPVSYTCPRDIPAFLSLEDPNGESVTVAYTATNKIQVYSDGSVVATYPSTHYIVMWRDASTVRVKVGSNTFTLNKQLATPVSVVAGAAKKCGLAGTASGLYDFIGVFRDHNIYITGLMPNDKVVVIAGAWSKTITAQGPIEVIDTLDIPTVDLVLALSTGGIRIIILPTRQHLQQLLPTGFWVKVKSEGAEGWYYVTAPLIMRCMEQLVVYSKTRTYTTTIYGNSFEIWSVKFNGKTLGVFPKVVVFVTDGTVTLTGKYGVVTLTASRDAPVAIDTGPGTYVVVRKGPMIRRVDYVSTITIVGKSYDVIAYLGR